VHKDFFYYDHYDHYDQTKCGAGFRGQGANIRTLTTLTTNPEKAK